MKLELKCRWFFLLVCFGLPGVGRAGSALAVSSTTGTPGTNAQVPVIFVTVSPVTQAQFDLLYHPAFLTPGIPTGGPSAAPDDIIASSQKSPGDLVVQIVSPSGALLKNGVVLYVPFTIASNELSPSEPLMLTNAACYDTNGNPVTPVSTANGTLTIAIAPHFNSIGLTNGVAHLGLEGIPGSNYVLQAATNLAAPQWKPMFTNTANSNGAVQFNDSGAGAVTKRFYRAVNTN